MEITGIKCDNNECSNYTILKEDPEAVNWLTLQLSSPGMAFRKKIHYCPKCAAQFVQTNNMDQESLDTGQRRVLNPEHVDPLLVQALTPSDHMEDDNHSGVPITQWQAPITPPTQPIPAPVGPGDVPHHHGIDVSILDPSKPVTAPKPRQRKQRAGAVVRGALTTVLAFFVGVGV